MGGIAIGRMELCGILFLLLSLSHLRCSFGRVQGGKQRWQQQHRRQIPFDISSFDRHHDKVGNGNRFPYFVHFPCHDKQQRNCGGSLIAPDIVLTSASCRGQCDRVKVSGLTSPSHNNHFNTFRILEEVVHPNYRDSMNTEQKQGTKVDNYNIMLLRIESDKTNAVIPTQTVALHSQSIDLPSEDEQWLSVLRANHTVEHWHGHFFRNRQHRQGQVALELEQSPSLTLQLPSENLVKYLPKQKCDFGVHGHHLNVSPLTPSPSNSFLCTTGANVCPDHYGSGWPLILKGDSYLDDIQIGISMRGCNYRDSNSLNSTRYYQSLTTNMEWITETVCDKSTIPPAEFNCPRHSSSISPVSNQRPKRITSDLPDMQIASNHLPEQARDDCSRDSFLVAVTLLILFDDKPEDTSWHIDNLSTSDGVIQRIPGFYDQTTHATEEIILLCPGNTYQFVIEDVEGNGMCCSIPGTYALQQRHNSSYLAHGGGDFGFSESSIFQVIGETGPTILTIWVIFVFDENAHEIGWSLTEVSTNTLVDRVQVGTYQKGEVVAIEEVIVQPGAAYSLTVEDSGEDGLCCEPEPGTYLVAFDNLILATNWGDFGSSETTEFTIPS